jgi:hypothetical protein
VADPPVAQRLAALRAPIITAVPNIGAIAGPRTRVYMIHAALPPALPTTGLLDVNYM